MTNEGAHLRIKSPQDTHSRSSHKCWRVLEIWKSEDIVVEKRSSITSSHKLHHRIVRKTVRKPGVVVSIISIILSEQCVASFRLPPSSLPLCPRQSTRSSIFAIQKTWLLWWILNKLSPSLMEECSNITDILLMDVKMMSRLCRLQGFLER